MAKYRQVQVSFWQDHFVLDLTPEEKYFYLYLMTNPKASQIGIYELPLKVVEFETGYNRETVEKLINRFEEYGKIKYSKETKEVLLINWVKHNWNTSAKVISRVKQELENVKDVNFIMIYISQAEEIEEDERKLKDLYRIDRVSEIGNKDEIPYRYKDKDKDKEKDKEKDKYPSAAQNHLETIIGNLTPFMIEDLDFYKDKFDEPNEIIMEALDISVARGKRNWNYAKAIVQKWKGEGLRTLLDVREFEEKPKTGNQPQINIDEL